LAAVRPLGYAAPVRIAYHVMSSPIGLLFLARSEQGLRHLEFMDRKSIKRMIARHAATAPDATWTPSLLELKTVVDQLDAYFCGALTEFQLPLDAVGTDFQHTVWKELAKIPFAQTRSYGEVARAIGQPRSARAVGLANNQNPIAIVVPCHRVIGADGSLTGYGGGVQRKRWLLQHEARFSKLAPESGDLFTAGIGRVGRRSG
jgi:methylated-DNA-[protein]-cysteine S-methyltransferase